MSAEKIILTFLWFILEGIMYLKIAFMLLTLELQLEAKQEFINFSSLRGSKAAGSQSLSYLGIKP